MELENSASCLKRVGGLFAFRVTEIPNTCRTKPQQKQANYNKRSVINFKVAKFINPLLERDKPAKKKLELNDNLFCSCSI